MVAMRFISLHGVITDYVSGLPCSIIVQPLPDPTEVLEGPMSAGGLDRWEGPSAVEDLRSRPVEPHPVVPAVHDRQAVDPFILAAAQMHRHTAVLIAAAGDRDDDVGVKLVLLEKALRVVETDRPEARINQAFFKSTRSYI